MRVSFFIVTHNSQVFISNCLKSLGSVMPPDDREILVFDNASTDKTVSIIQTQFSDVCVYPSSVNLGYSTAINQLFTRSQGDFVFILNPDSVFESGNIYELLALFQQNSKLGIVGPQLLDSDKSVQLSCRAFPSYSSALFNRHSFLTKLFPKSRLANRYLKTSWSHDTISCVDWVSGAAMVIRRQCFESLGGFDQGFFMYCEDVDICKRAHDQGWAVEYYPMLKLIHHIGGSINRKSIKAIIWHHRSMIRFYRKHYRINFLWDSMVIAGIIFRAGYHIVFSAVMRLFRNRSGND